MPVLYCRRRDKKSRRCGIISAKWKLPEAVMMSLLQQHLPTWIWVYPWIPMKRACLLEGKNCINPRFSASNINRSQGWASNTWPLFFFKDYSNETLKDASKVTVQEMFTSVISSDPDSCVLLQSDKTLFSEISRRVVSLQYNPMAIQMAVTNCELEG